ncbi:hypothetical protein IEQ34_018353 [Dendrobium chrysotoxum]|uniref:Uncharacterized protein n=1 Tax=Dendrobium chrysotoxum TaxID=161865 RepID=A0AAV7GDQ5_DENCH|nr:hypothetical protein IEQ34_018353 [Dendrobium chrysotoxum]
MADNKNTKAKKGWLVVAVGLDGDEFRRFTIPITYLHHPLFLQLLESARETYGYSAEGPLRLPCSIEDFLHLRSEKVWHEKGKIYYGAYKACFGGKKPYSGGKKLCSGAYIRGMRARGPFRALRLWNLREPKLPTSQALDSQDSRGGEPAALRLLVIRETLCLLVIRGTSASLSVWDRSIGFR